jgi:hypothetical protein
MRLMQLTQTCILRKVKEGILRNLDHTAFSRCKDICLILRIFQNSGDPPPPKASQAPALTSLSLSFCNIKNTCYQLQQPKILYLASHSGCSG